MFVRKAKPQQSKFQCVFILVVDPPYFTVLMQEEKNVKIKLTYTLNGNLFTFFSTFLFRNSHKFKI